jgi:YHS domain-containing protein
MKDPVCGMEVSEKNESIVYNGIKFHFCCASCKWAFEKTPEEFTKT